MTMTQTERRRFPRMNPEVAGRIRAGSGWIVDVDCIDLSAGGALIVCPRRVEVGDLVELFLSRLGEGRPTRVRGEVVRHAERQTDRPPDAPCVMALRFEEADGTTRLELDELVGIETPAPVPVERRKNERYDGRFLVTFHTEREFLHEYTENLSSYGMFLRTDEKIEVGAEVDVELVLPNYHDPVDIRARVVRRVAPDPQAGVSGGLGIEFVEPDARAISFVEERAGAYRAAGF